MIFKTPLILWLIPFIFILILYLNRKQKGANFLFPSKDLLTSLPLTWKIKLRNLPVLLRFIIILLFCIALAGPRSVSEETVYEAEGISIVLAVDSSGSMAAEDFEINNQRVNRLEIVKKVVSEFIQERHNDQIGLISFAGLAYTVCPLTTDYSWLETNLERLEIGMIQDGTAIGSAIVSSVRRLKNSEIKSKVIILLTDGINNAGKIDPISAARASQALGIKIYTIGAGTKGLVPYPAKDAWGRKGYQNVRIELDEETLKKIADITKGKYFRATDTESLRQIYKEIDILEKTKIKEFGYTEYDELFDKFLLISLILLLLEIVLKQTIFLKVP